MGCAHTRSRHRLLLRIGMLGLLATHSAAAQVDGIPGLATGFVPGALLVSPGPGAEDGCKEPGTSTPGGLMITRWDSLGITLRTPNPWRPDCTRQAPGRADAQPRTEETQAAMTSEPGHEGRDSPTHGLPTQGWFHDPPFSDQEVRTLWDAFREAPSAPEFSALADALFSRADWVGLQEAARVRLEHAPGSPEALERLGMACLSLGQEDEAVRAFQEIGEGPIQDAVLWDRAGVLLMMTHRADLAEPLLRKAVTARPDDPIPARHLALLLWELEQPEEAARIVETLLETTHADPVTSAVLRDDLALFYHAALANGGDDWEIRMRAVRRDVNLEAWHTHRVVLDWYPNRVPVTLLMASDGEDSSPRAAGREELSAPKASCSGLASVRLDHERTGTWHVGAAGGVSERVQGTAMVIVPDFRRQISLVLVQPFTLEPGQERDVVRHLLSFDLPGGQVPGEVEAETTVLP